MSIENSVKRDTRIEYFEKPTPTTLKRTVKDDARERIELEIGDEKQVEAFPQAKIKKWDNEVNFSIRRDNGSRSWKEQDGMIVFESEDEDVRFYELDGFEDGGLEVELLLKKKPKTNVFDFTIETKGLNFFYQGELTKAEIDEGAERPEHVVGSYAVYHSTKKNNRVGGKSYKTGMFAHIYRPKVIDANNKEIWASLNIDKSKKKLQITVPQDYLDNATYPVIVDPTIGNTTFIGSSYGIFPVSPTTDYSAVSMLLDAPDTISRINSIHIVHRTVGSGDHECNLKGVIYDSTNSIIASSETSSVNRVKNGFTAESVQLDCSTPVVYDESSIYFSVLFEYILGAYPSVGAADPNVSLGVPYREHDLASYVFPSSVNLTGGSAYSMYLTYSVSIATNDATDVSYTSATLNGAIENLEGGGNATERGFVISTTSRANPGNISPASSSYEDVLSESGASYGISSFSFGASSLTDGVTYYFRAYYLNSNGYIYGEELEFVTIELTPPFVSTTGVSNITQTTADVNAEILSDGGGTITERGVVYNTAGSPTTSDSKEVVAGTIGSFTANLSALSIATTYYVRVYAINSYGTSYGEELSFSTQSYDPPTVETGVVTDITADTSTFNGDVTSSLLSVTKRGFVYDTTSRAKPADGTSLLTSDDFETGFGNWVNVFGDNYDWTRDSGGTPSSGTGPSTGNGGSTWYVFTETSSGTTGSTFFLENDLGATKSGYVDFYYHMYGASMGTLRLEGWNGSTWTEIWSLSGDQGNTWYNATTPATNFTGYSKLRFVGVRGTSYTGDMALDDISVYESTTAPAPASTSYANYVEETGTYSTGTYSVGATSLTPSTTYYVRAYAYNSEGYSYADNEVSFTTISLVTTYTSTINSSQFNKRTSRLTETNSGDYASSTSTTHTFTPTQVFTIEKIRILCKGTDAGSTTVSITINGVTSDTVNIGDTSSTPQFYEFTFSSPVTVLPVETTLTLNNTGNFIVSGGGTDGSDWNFGAF